MPDYLQPYGVVDAVFARSGWTWCLLHQFVLSLYYLIVFGAMLFHREKHIPDDLQHVPCHRHLCLLLAASLCYPLVDRLHPGVSRMDTVAASTNMLRNHWEPRLVMGSPVRASPLFLYDGYTPSYGTIFSVVTKALVNLGDLCKSLFKKRARLD